MIKTDLSNPDLIVASLKNNKVVVLPTDTIYGLSCRVGSPAAITKIYKIKSRDPKKTPIILVGSWCMLKKYAFVSAAQDKYLRTIWIPTARPSTVILRARDILPKNVVAADGSVALRLPSKQFLAKIIKLLGEPIISTSLNISDQPSLNSVKYLDKYFPEAKFDLVVDAGVLENESSRIIDIRDIKNIKIIRN
jgi:tRNA threonylcarbamoyl adenosine modification protein (Sua5/YciO/YrdC/YwlC family)